MKMKKEIKRCKVCKKKLRGNSTSGYCRIHHRESLENQQQRDKYFKKYYKENKISILKRMKKWYKRRTKSEQETMVHP